MGLQDSRSEIQGNSKKYKLGLILFGACTAFIWVIYHYLFFWKAFDLEKEFYNTMGANIMSRQSFLDYKYSHDLIEKAMNSIQVKSIRNEFDMHDMVIDKNDLKKFMPRLKLRLRTQLRYDEFATEVNNEIDLAIDQAHGLKSSIHIVTHFPLSDAYGTSFVGCSIFGFVEDPNNNTNVMIGVSTYTEEWNGADNVRISAHHKWDPQHLTKYVQFELYRTIYDRMDLNYRLNSKDDFTKVIKPLYENNNNKVKYLSIAIIALLGILSVNTFVGWHVVSTLPILFLVNIPTCSTILFLIISMMCKYYTLSVIDICNCYTILLLFVYVEISFQTKRYFVNSPTISRCCSNECQQNVWQRQKQECKSNIVLKPNNNTTIKWMNFKPTINKSNLQWTLQDIFLTSDQPNVLWRRNIQQLISQLISHMEPKNLQRVEYVYQRKNKNMFSNENYSEHIVINKKYKDLKMELLNNPMYTLTMQKFDMEYRKGTLFFTSTGCRRYAANIRSQTMHNNNKKAEFTIEHMIFLMVRSNCYELWYAINNTYRKQSNNETYLELAKRHQNFYWCGKLIAESVKQFGISTSQLYGRHFYGGIRPKLLFVAHILDSLSKTSEIDVAINFTDYNTGLIVDFTDYNAWYINMYFDVSWLSNYSYESRNILVHCRKNLEISTIIVPQFINLGFQSVLDTLKQKPKETETIQTQQNGNDYFYFIIHCDNKQMRYPFPLDLKQWSDDMLYNLKLKTKETFQIKSDVVLCEDNEMIVDIDNIYNLKIAVEQKLRNEFDDENDKECHRIRMLPYDKYSWIILSEKPDCIMGYTDEDNIFRAEMPCKHAIAADTMFFYIKSIIEKNKDTIVIKCPNKNCNIEWDWDNCLKIADMTKQETLKYNAIKSNRISRKQFTFALFVKNDTEIQTMSNDNILSEEPINISDFSSSSILSHINSDDHSSSSTDTVQNECDNLEDDDTISLRERVQQREHFIYSLSALQTELSNQDKQTVPNQLPGNNSADNRNDDSRSNNSNNYNQQNNQNNFNNNNNNNPPNGSNKSGYYCNVPTHCILMHKNRQLTVENNKLKHDRIKVQQRLNQQIEFNRQLAIKLHQEKQFHLLTKIDFVMDKYYKSQGNNAYLLNGIGKLSQYVTEKHINNGEFSLYEEFENKSKPKRIIYSDLDTKFPLPNNVNIGGINSYDLKEEIIFNIVQYCYFHNKPPTNQYLHEHFSKTAFSVSKSTVNLIDETKLQSPLQDLVQIKDINCELTILDNLYAWIRKQGIERTKLTQIRSFLHEEEYDSDALAIDILQTEKYDSNMVQKLMKNPYEHLLIRSFMQQNTKNCYSFPRKRIKLSMNFTKYIVPSCIDIKSTNIYQYMIKFTSIYNNSIIKYNDKLSIIDYNVCSKVKQNKLYAIADRDKSINPQYCVWKVRDKFYTQNEIKNICQISKMELDKPMQIRLMVMQKLKQERDKIKLILENKKEMKRLFFSKWDGNRVPICNKKTKSALKKCLQLNKYEFSKRIMNNNINKIKLLSIVTYNGGKYIFENVWIVALDIALNSSTKIKKTKKIAISLKLTRNRNKVPLLPTAIYLDICDAHELVCFEQLKYGCHCLDNFICDMDELRIESECVRLSQKNKMLESSLYKTKIQLKSFEDIIIENSIVISGKNKMILELENKLDKKERMMKKLDIALQTELKQLAQKQKDDKAILNRICNECFV